MVPDHEAWCAAFVLCLRSLAYAWARAWIHKSTFYAHVHMTKEAQN